MLEYYEIRIKDRLDPLWSESFAGLKITYPNANETLLTGVLPDQSALHGLFKAIRDLNLVLISVYREERCSSDNSFQDR